jgi:ketosteroid isomerase-like protein
MSSENVALVQRASAAWNAGDLQALEEAYSPEIEWRDLQHAPDAPEIVRGIEAVKRIWVDWLDAFPDLRADVSEYIDVDDAVVCLTHWHGSGKESGARIDNHTVDVIEIQDGRIARATFGYGTKEEALEATNHRT